MNPLSILWTSYKSYEALTNLMNFYQSYEALMNLMNPLSIL